MSDPQEDFVVAVRAVGQAFLQAVREAAQATAEFVNNTLMPAMRQAYIDQGEPLGPGDDAMIAWMRIQADLEAGLPEQTILAEDEEEAWDDLVKELDQ